MLSTTARAKAKAKEKEAGKAKASNGEQACHDMLPGSKPYICSVAAAVVCGVVRTRSKLQTQHCQGRASRRFLLPKSSSAGVPDHVRSASDLAAAMYVYKNSHTACSGAAAMDVEEAETPKAPETPTAADADAAADAASRSANGGTPSKHEDGKEKVQLRLAPSLIVLTRAAWASRDDDASLSIWLTVRHVAQENDKPAPAAPEPTAYEVANPARVVLAQQRFIAFPPDGRWQPLQPGARSGIVLLRDTRPSECRMWPLPHVAGARTVDTKCRQDLSALPSCDAFTGTNCCWLAIVGPPRLLDAPRHGLVWALDARFSVQLPLFVVLAQLRNEQGVHWMSWSISPCDASTSRSFAESVYLRRRASGAGDSNRAGRQRRGGPGAAARRRAGGGAGPGGRGG